MKFIFIFNSLLKNIFFQNKIFFIIDGYQWVVHEISKEKKKYLGKNFIITSTSKFIKNSVIHFGTLNAFLILNKKKKIHNSNKIIVTIHHLPNLEKNLQDIIANKHNVNLWIVSTIDIKNKLEKLKIKNLKYINICVESEFFKNIIAKKDLSNEIIIGSFVKDGGTLDEIPKHVKGPDILINILNKINQKIKIKVILTGPNREWIKKKLKEKKIEYQHYNYSYAKTLKLFSIVDFIIVTSRIEGGPRCIMEAAHSKVPIISTNVGIIKDHFTNKKNFILIDDNKMDESVLSILNIIKNNDLRLSIINSAYEIRNNFSMKENINKYKKIYSKYNNKINF